MASPAARFKQTTTGDLDFTNGLQLESNLTNSVVAKVRKVLLLFQASWYLDLSKGVPWIQNILAKKNPKLRLVAQAISSAILANVPEVTRVISGQISFDRTSRVLNYSATLLTTVGAVPFSAPLALP